MLNRNTSERTVSVLLTYALIGVAIFLPWRTFITNIFVLASAILWFLDFRHNRKYFSPQVRFFILLLISVYLVELIGITYTENIRYGLHRLESKLSIFAFPVIIIASSIKKKQINSILLAFVSSTVLACLVCIIRAIFIIGKNGEPLSALVNQDVYSYMYLTEPLQHIHPTFLTLFICLSVFIITDYVRIHNRYYALLAINVFLIFFAFLLASRAGYAAMALTLIMIGFAFIGLKRKALLATYALILVVGFVLSVSFSPTIKKRLIDDVRHADIAKEQVNSVTYHLKTWVCSIESWLDGHILFGYGTGDEVNVLTSCYESKNWLGNRHDAHNEFLSSLVKHGLFGLTILMISFFYPFYLALKYRNFRYVTFLVTILLCFLAESMLRGQTGLVFFTLFNALFLKDLLLDNQLIPEIRSSDG